jgi:hypothetical protein
MKIRGLVSGSMAAVALAAAVTRAAAVTTSKN